MPRKLDDYPKGKNKLPNEEFWLEIEDLEPFKADYNVEGTELQKEAWQRLENLQESRVGMTQLQLISLTRLIDIIYQLGQHDGREQYKFDQAVENSRR
jgi:hypothetical protein